MSYLKFSAAVVHARRRPEINNSDNNNNISHRRENLVGLSGWRGVVYIDVDTRRSVFTCREITTLIRFVDVVVLADRVKLYAVRRVVIISLILCLIEIELRVDYIFVYPIYIILGRL